MRQKTVKVKAYMRRPPPGRGGKQKKKAKAKATVKATGTGKRKSGRIRKTPKKYPLMVD